MFESFKHKAYGLREVEQYAHTYARNLESTEHPHGDEELSSKTELKKDESRTDHQERREWSNAHHTGAHRISDRKAASEYYEHSFEHTHSEDTERA
jgi:hypothetical protein